MTASTTPLHALHLRLGGRMVDFAGYELPVNYPAGIIAEHGWTRAHAGLFDVSHMGQAILAGEGASARLETLLPGDIQSLGLRKIRYSQFTNAEGGILDDLMVTKIDEDGDVLFLVVNAACKRADFARIRAHLPDLGLNVLEDRALIALQGPQAAQALERHVPGASALPFMTQQEFCWREQTLYISRSGYTGEDGFEISVAAEYAQDFAECLLAEEEVEAVGLGARDSLRLEAGLCLYGHDLDATTSPIEAGLGWSISKRRRAEGGFPGAARIRREGSEGVTRQCVGLLLDGKAPAREGAEIADATGAIIGRVTSGGFAPSLGKPIAMGYVPPHNAAPGTPVSLIVRGKPLSARVAPLPFVPNRYHR
jgi:aminomethyltransferase